MTFSSSRPVAVGLFDRGSQAEQAIQALRGVGLTDQQLGLATADVSGLLAGSAAGADLTGTLVSLGVPEGEARFYAREVQAGQALVVVDAGSNYDAARDLLRQHGARDVQSEGKALARGDSTPDGAAGGVQRPGDVTERWEDVRSRYEMLFEQHYGTSDTTWPQAEPLYRYAWQRANAPELRGRPWSAVEDRVRRDWEDGRRTPTWSEAVGPLRDVWDDVAAEAAAGAEGGAERRVPRQGADQAGPASEVHAPRGPA